MSLWTLTPLVAALLLGAHPGPVVGQGPVLAAATQTNPSSPALASVSAGTTPVLQQLGNGDWKTTVLVTGADDGCPIAKGDYWLNTTSPDMTIQPKSNAVPVGSESGASCEITLTFAGQKIAVPATATLVLGGTSALPLAIARNIKFVGYIVFPLVGAFAMAILLLGFSLWRIRVYNWNREKQGPFRKDQANVHKKLLKYVNKEFWQHEIYASGAWTLNDSWATNITTALAVITAAIGLVPATELFFHGVALDRFSILSTIAGGLAAAAPLVVAVRYASWIHRHPGVTDDAELSLPTGTWPDSGRRLDGSFPLILTSGTLIAVDQKDLPEPDPPDAKKPAGQGSSPHQKVRAQLAVSAFAKLTAPALATTASADGEWVVLLPGAEPATVELLGGTEVVLASGQHTELKQLAEIGLPVGAVARIAAPSWDVLMAAVQAEDAADRIAAAGWPVLLVVVQDENEAQDQDEAGDQPRRNDSVTEIDVPSGATVTVLWGATVCDQESAEPRAAHVQAGGKIQIPPDSTIRVTARRIALPGGSDMMLHGTSVLLVSGGDHADPCGTLSIVGSDVTLPKDALADDVQLPLPAFVTSPSGAKITVNGVAAVTIPVRTEVRTRYRREFPLKDGPLHTRLPQGPNSLGGTMGMTLLAGLVTMFGIGMQIGIVAVLIWLSEATHWAQALMWAGLFGLVVFTLLYSVTAIRALADPEPGSSMSTTAGTSFTL